MSSGSKQNLHLKFYSLLVFATVAAFGPVVLINQPLWDDWVLRAYSDAGTLWELYRQVGARELFWLVKPFASTAPSVCVATELLLYALLGPLIYTIIRKTTLWSPSDAFWAALLTVLVPLNQARFVLSTLPYAFSSFFFALSIVLLLRDLEKPSIIGRLSIAICLLVAFTTNSFLVLAWLMPLVVAVDASRSEASPTNSDKAREALRAILRRGELLLLPAVYWLAKKVFEPTYGLYADYNKFQMGLASALKQTVVVLVSQFKDARTLLPHSSDVPELSVAAAIVIAIFLLAALSWKLPLDATDEPPRGAARPTDAFAMAIGLALAVCSLLPYVLVGKPPRFYGLWETRHQTTLMLFSGFVIYSALRLSVPRRALPAASAVLAAFFLVLNISVTHRLVLDALETREISSLLEAQPPAPGTMMLVMEEDRNYRALGRFFAFYELSYVLNPDGEHRVLAVSNQEILDPSTGTYVTGRIPAVESKLIDLCEKYRSAPQYGFGGFVSNGNIETVRLLSNREPPRLFEVIGESIRSAVNARPASTSPMVRIERKASAMEGACRSPCCAGD
ncbi:hypothetical protein IVB27_11640 [Bradyrhizobium sp. 197]|uniref:hypothetical protein n=1 Tax=Bradyrhizobium sp. 197 TaxID=2782663 RepID=UPI001FF98759|nr:hypothetical protein [Bradyrhizobium sp. 197]MCK1475437.1 hypothetical protein [Bradyrhizobium sp. 197]